MMVTDRLEQLMGEIGPLVRSVEEIRHANATTWVVFFDDNSQLEIEANETARKLTLSTTVGAPSEEHLLRTYEAMLVYNRLWGETDGVRTALEKPGGDVVMAFDLFTLDLDVSTLATVIDNIHDKRNALRESLAAIGENEPAEKAEVMGGPIHGIRV